MDARGSRSSGDDLTGSSADNVLDGRGGDDHLNGLNGDDILIGDVGNDTMKGGNGSDTFDFAAGDGNDVIQDFEDGSDVLRFEGLTFDNLSIKSTGGGSNTVIRYGDGDSVVLKNVTAADITMADFEFI